MMMSCTIDVKENRYVSVAYIPGTFLHDDMNKEIYMLLEGIIAEIIIKLDFKLYRKYIWENRKKAYAIRQAKEDSLWYATSSAPFLEAIVMYVDRMGI